MNKNTFFSYINRIINDFDSFKEDVENLKEKSIEEYFKDDDNSKDYSANEFLSSTIYFESQLLMNKNAIEVYELYMELITYLTYLKNNIYNQAITNKVRLTISLLQDYFIPLVEKLVRIEVLKLLNIMFHYEDLLQEDKIPQLCNNFHLDLNTYLYLLGHDECETIYKQFSFLPGENKLSELDNIAGARRINYRKKLTNDLNIQFLKSTPLNEALPLIKEAIGNNAFDILEKELNKLIERKGKEKKKVDDDGFQYFFTIK